LRRQEVVSDDAMAMKANDDDWWQRVGEPEAPNAVLAFLSVRTSTSESTEAKRYVTVAQNTHALTVINAILITAIAFAIF